MKTHAQIVADAESAQKLAEITGASIHTVRSWAQRNSIPAKHWAALSGAGIATLQQLAAAAAETSPAEAA